MNKLWLDDQRPAPAGFLWAKTAREAVKLIAAGGIEFVVFDHDLGAGHTGYDVACLIEALAADGLQPPGWSVHSANPDGCKRINAAMQSAHRLYREARYAQILASGLRRTTGSDGCNATAW